MSEQAENNSFRYVVNEVEETQAIAKNLSHKLRFGDLIMLSGDLGAGKTTFTQGLGIGLNVRGQVSSPTFIVARAHPSLVDGPNLIHVDAYRITSLDDLETLDLDSSIDEAVTVVEWGDGKVEGLSQSRLEIKIIRQIGEYSKGNSKTLDLHENVVDLTDVDEGKREIIITPIGPRWENETLDSLL
ncbi:tRNA (adenosine(37)-N6)-threonylcarbamoyltransferase complex ATPase subunit type 1 TsaE [Actinomyces sp. zg-332]|uniref:tRNA (adenosine(37)-N6)-threonylcarbamoyltransferase complex ATPase subunit type 1 TsaE n=1 Tax=Actinomyces sp. zg-332 TaxID=2708340 RepID=UPI001420872B|nr:tRNA (adenosine(37)-N6)-threonylcarbamoyltransferase complex ATPase subunit type 1 TsaE [Actinomyces sp. zg-332]QPK94373.1 tRNA (adenosine(37)-N6)-threonylcarbamoyltransferase complex ATPase subunit type 1 TsaE [Actinomyces sp. zg-332]